VVAVLASAILIPAEAVEGQSSDSSPGFTLVRQTRGEPQEGQTRKTAERQARPIQVIGYLDLGVATMKSDTASRLQTSRSGFAFSLGGGLSFFKFFDVGVGFGLVFLKDKNPFTNLTTGGERKSTVTPLIYFAQVGLQVPIPIKNASGLFPVWIGVHAGPMGVSASRDIPTCSNCDVEKLSFKGGSFLKPEIKLQIARHVFFGLAYTLFCPKCEFENMITLSFMGSFSED
jgi:hypothetical protein